MSYTLYGRRGAASLAPMALLEACGADYRFVEVDAAEIASPTSTYRQIQPLGQVPALDRPEGSMFESAAMMLWIADRHGLGDWAPALDDPNRGRYLQWIAYLGASIYPTFQRYYYAERVAADAEDARARALADLPKRWAPIETALTERAWLAGDRATAADLYLMMLATWDAPEETFPSRCPAIARTARAAARLPGVDRALARHDIPEWLTAAD